MHNFLKKHKKKKVDYSHYSGGMMYFCCVDAEASIWSLFAFSPRLANRLIMAYTNKAPIAVTPKAISNS